MHDRVLWLCVLCLCAICVLCLCAVFVCCACARCVCCACVYCALTNNKRSMRTMQVWKKRNYEKPKRSMTQLKLFLRTRGKIVNDVSKQVLLDICEQTLRDEANIDSAVRLYLTPYDDGLAEKKRRQLLIKAGVLTAVNAPGHVAPPCPEITDPGWQVNYG